MKIKTYLIFILAICTISSSKLPYSTCISLDKQVQSYPISVNQTQIFNMDKLFDGFNLTFSIENYNAAKLTQKMDKVSSIRVNNQGLQRYHLGHQKQQWRKQLITIGVMGNKTIIRWGSSTKEETFPNLSNEAILTNDPTITCFDAFWFISQQTILVDCLQNKNKKLQNIFLYLNSSSKVVLQRLSNNIYVPFKSIQDRKIEVINKNGQKYLIRAYFSNKVNPQLEDKAYIEVMLINNLLKPHTIGIIDKSIIRSQKFTIMDFIVYLDSIFILNYHTGVVKIDIQSNNDLVISDKYSTSEGFSKLGVYFDSLDDSYFLALANQQRVLQIKWKNSYTHEIIAKYSIPKNSQIHCLWINGQYVVVHLTADLTNSKDKTSSYESTYIFTKQSLTYLNPHSVINHRDTQTIVDFNQEQSSLLIINTNQIVIYNLNHPILVINPTNTEKKELIFKVIAKSNDYQANSMICIVPFSFKIYQTQSPQFIWPLDHPWTYNVNKQGTASIPLNTFALAPNLNYKTTPKSLQTPKIQLLHQNPSQLTWRQKKVSLFKYSIFLQTQYNTKNNQFFLFLQDLDNFTEFVKCSTSSSKENQVSCVARYMPHMNFQMAELTATQFEHMGKSFHFLAVKYKILDTDVIVYDVQNEYIALIPFRYPQTPEKTISSLQYVGKYLAVVFQYSKEIYVYDMNRCLNFRDDMCQQSFIIDKKMMPGLGIDYFAPVKAHASSLHPNILFIQCIDRIIMFVISQQGPTLQAQLKLDKEFNLNKRQIIIGKSKIILINPPNIIKEFDFSQITHSKTLTLLKKYPTYRYIIGDSFSSACSDNSNLCYITAIDPQVPSKLNKVVLIYKTDVPAVASLYHTYPFPYQCDDLRIGVTGKTADYVTLVYGSKITMFMQYDNPTLKITELSDDYSLKLIYTNDPLQVYWYSNTIELKIVSIQQKIKMKDSRLNDDIIINQFDYHTNLVEQLQ